jgi:hypothetical protein
MAIILADRVKVRSHSTGIGDFALENVVYGFQSFSAIGDGNETYYGIVDAAGNWEVGKGTFSAVGNILSRDLVLDSSNSGSIVNFPSGGKTVFSTYPASVATTVVGGSLIVNELNNGIFSVVLDSAGNVRFPNDVTQSSSDNISCAAGVDTVIYSTSSASKFSVRLFVQVEGLEAPSLNWDTQSCDIIAVRGYRNDTVQVSVFGLTYTSSLPIATFDGQWNPTTSRLEITARPSSLSNSVVASVHAIELESND